MTRGRYLGLAGQLDILCTTWNLPGFNSEPKTRVFVPEHSIQSKKSCLLSIQSKKLLEGHAVELLVITATPVSSRT